MTPKQAAQLILRGELVVFPTETVYGLGALASNESAVKKIFQVKGRPKKNPLILHISRPEQIRELVQEVTPEGEKLIRHFWPGPLTLCLKKSKVVSEIVSAGLPTVCVRCPSDPIAQEFLREVGGPVAAPSANLSGRPSTTSSEDAQEQLEKKGVHFLPGGETEKGLESTIIDASVKPPLLLRPGHISKSQLEEVLGMEVREDTAPKKPRSPGQLLRHYAPKGKLTIIVGERSKRREWLKNRSINAQEKCCFGLVGEVDQRPMNGEIFILSPRGEDMGTYASRLYRFLNWCDHRDAKHIFLELPAEEHPLSGAIINRLMKASAGNMVWV